MPTLVIPSEQIERADPALIQKVLENKIPSVALHESQGQTGRLPSDIRPIADFDGQTVANVAVKRFARHFNEIQGRVETNDPALEEFLEEKVLKKPAYVAGPAVTCNLTPGDNLFFHAVAEQAYEGCVVVIGSTDPSQPLNFGNFGDLLAEQLKYRKVAGVVIDGSCRDITSLLDMADKHGLEVFVRKPCIQGTTKDKMGNVNMDVTMKDGPVTTVIRAGDLVVFDVDGGVIVPKENLEAVIAKSLERMDVTEPASRKTYSEGGLSLDGKRSLRTVIAGMEAGPQ